MNTTRFHLNFLELVKILKTTSFPQSQLAELAMNAALKLEELELQDRQISLQEEKTRQEIELQIIQAKNLNKQAIAEALKSIIQAESMARSVQDNALINKSNAHVGFLNVVGNANDTSAIKAHADKVMQTINLINGNPLNEEYDTLLDNLRDELLEALKKGDGCKDVLVYAHRTEILENERIKILGFSSYGNNETRFFINEEQVQTPHAKSLLFTQAHAGLYSVRFEAKNDAGEWIADTITIEVRSIV